MTIVVRGTARKLCQSDSPSLLRHSKGVTTSCVQHSRGRGKQLKSSTPQLSPCQQSPTVPQNRHPRYEHLKSRGAASGCCASCSHLPCPSCTRQRSIVPLVAHHSIAPLVAYHYGSATNLQHMPAALLAVVLVHVLEAI